jgi:hypothetical protein
MTARPASSIATLLNELFVPEFALKLNSRRMKMLRNRNLEYQWINITSKIQSAHKNLTKIFRNYFRKSLGKRGGRCKNRSYMQLAIIVLVAAMNPRVLRTFIPVWVQANLKQVWQCVYSTKKN